MFLKSYPIGPLRETNTRQCSRTTVPEIGEGYSCSSRSKLRQLETCSLPYSGPAPYVLDPSFLLSPSCTATLPLLSRHDRLTTCLATIITLTRMTVAYKRARYVGWYPSGVSAFEGWDRMLDLNDSDSSFRGLSRLGFDHQMHLSAIVALHGESGSLHTFEPAPSSPLRSYPVRLSFDCPAAHNAMLQPIRRLSIKQNSRCGISITNPLNTDFASTVSSESTVCALFRNRHLQEATFYHGAKPSSWHNGDSLVNKQCTYVIIWLRHTSASLV
jgi:hypothetical protein